MDQIKHQPANRRAIIVISIVLGCLCVAVLALGGYDYYYFTHNINLIQRLPGQPNNGSTEQTPVSVTRTQVDSIPTDTVGTLDQTVIPDNDPYDLACRIENICNVAHTLPAPSTRHFLGSWARRSTMQYLLI